MLVPIVEHTDNLEVKQRDIKYLVMEARVVCSRKNTCDCS